MVPSIQCKIGVKICHKKGDRSDTALHSVSNESTNLPGVVKFVMANKVGMIPPKRIQNQTLVRFRDLCLRETPLVRQVHLGGDRTSVETRGFRVELEVYGFGWLDPDHELIACDVLEYTLRHILKLNSDLHLGLVECYARLMEGLECG